MHSCIHSVHVIPQGQVCTVLCSSLCDSSMQGPNASLLTAATESSAVMEKEVARLEQVNKDVKAACQGLQATVDDLSR
jgi:TolA-binding protein